MDVTVVIATFGDDKWARLANDRAAPSVPDRVPVILSHAATLHEARNMGLAKVTTEFVCHLDADDELTPDYFKHMSLFGQDADIRVPAVQYVRGTQRQQANIPQVWNHHHDCQPECLRQGNWIVIGAVARTRMLREVGGWHDFQWSEDWATWALCWRAGATFARVPSAVYVAHVRPDSRNRGVRRAFKLAEHERIERFVWPEEAAA